MDAVAGLLSGDGICRGDYSVLTCLKSPCDFRKGHGRTPSSQMDVWRTFYPLCLVAHDKYILGITCREEASKACDVFIRLKLRGIWLHPLH